MTDKTKRLLGLLWASKGYMILGSTLAVAGTVLAMRGAYWEGTHEMLAALTRIDSEKMNEIIDESGIPRD